MRLLHLDCFAGISGDMLLGALLEIGAAWEPLESLPKRLGLHRVAVTREQVTKKGLVGTKVQISKERSPPHRHLSSILEAIDAAELPPPAAERARSVFRRIGEVEAAIHGVPVERVHFHEIGAHDSIVDIVGACLLFESLEVDGVHASPVAIGSGSKQMAHGVLPLPAPATLRLLEGIPTAPSGLPRELATPTGVALLASLEPRFSPLPPARALASGYGAGSQDLPDRPNLLRASLWETVADRQTDLVTVLETHIDDMSPELAGTLAENLRQAGAFDVLLLPAYGKGGRPGFLLHVVAAPDMADELEGLLFGESSTFGIRRSNHQRSILERAVVSVETPYGPIGVKVGRWHGTVVTVSAEHRECVAAAVAHGVPVKECHEAAVAAYRLTRSQEPPNKP